MKKTLLVTGGTGSFGRKVATQLRNKYNVRIFSRDEKKQYEMEQSHPEIKYIIGDVRNYESLLEAMRGVDYVFHAAALKQVPTCENHPEEALATNCLGPLNVCRAAIANGVKKVVALSTDKAVQPINAMGVSKALMEKIIVAHASRGHTTKFVCTRYGNILGSRGSILPVWYSQIKNRQARTITDMKMKRFLMNLSDSLELVEHALTSPANGSIFVWKAPAITIEELLQAVSKKTNEDPHFFTIVGRRPGEKIHETLVCEDELYRAVDTGKYIEILPHEYTRVQTDLKEPFSTANARKPSEEEVQRMLTKAEQDMESVL